MTTSATPESLGPESLGPEATKSSLPNTLTVARLVAAPIVAALILFGGHVLYTLGSDISVVMLSTALVIFLLAALTDWLDGALARKLDATSVMGAALDHAADKALVTGSLIALAATALPFDLVCAAAIIVTRDVAVAGLREGLSLAGRALPVSSLGKVKTAVELVGVGAAILLQIAAIAVPHAERAVEPLDVVAFIARASLWAAAALALWSGADYAREAMKK